MIKRKRVEMGTGDLGLGLVTMFFNNLLPKWSQDSKKHIKFICHG